MNQIQMLTAQAERYERLAKLAPEGSAARKAAEVTAATTREALAWYHVNASKAAAPSPTTPERAPDA